MKDLYEEELYALIERRTSESDIVNNYKEFLERRRTNDNTHRSELH
jgi:hypothetical protein